MDVNGWGSGLPPAGANQSSWALLAPLLANPLLRPGHDEMETARDHFVEMLRIRGSTPLFRLRTAAEVESQVTFLDAGPGQLPGLVVMHVDAPAKVQGPYGDVVVLFNAAPYPQSFTAPVLQGEKLGLHPVQQASADPVVRTSTFDRGTGTFTVPARTTAVFVAKERHRKPCR
jgi:pullulanase/glycogen debranching enzyme